MFVFSSSSEFVADRMAGGGKKRRVQVLRAWIQLPHPESVTAGPVGVACCGRTVAARPWALATLCDVDACMVVYDEEDSQPEVWLDVPTARLGPGPLQVHAGAGSVQEDDGY